MLLPLANASVQVPRKGPAAALVASDSRWLTDLVAHAYVAALELSREGGSVELEVAPRETRVTLAVLAMAAQRLRPPAADGRRYRKGQVESI